MNYFFIGILIIGFSLAIAAFVKVSKIEKALKDKGVLPEDWDS